MVTRPTAEVPLTLDAKTAARRKWDELASRERRLIVEREKAETGKRTPITRKINACRKEMDTVAADIAAGQVLVTVSGVSRGQYRDLLKQHPPKDGDELDKRVGYNMDTFGGGLIRAATLSAVDAAGKPVPLDVDAWIDDDEGVAAGDFERWFRACLELQTRPVDQSPPLRAS